LAFVIAAPGEVLRARGFSFTPLEAVQMTMRRAIVVATAVLTLLILPAMAAVESYKIDPVHSTVSFTIRHLVSRVRGNFTELSGAIQLDRDNPAEAKITATIATASVNTANEKRDEHLRSPDFFDAEKYPAITFESNGVKVHSAERVTLMGNLTMHGVTKPVSLDVTGLGFGSDPWGGFRAGFEAETTLNRKDYGIVWNSVLDTGGLALGDEVKVEILIEAIREKESLPTEESGSGN
jgi:polyisoprenoid-binding protein YceI